MGVARQDSVFIIICVYATPIWQFSVMKWDVHITISSEGAAATSDVQHQAFWCALDGPDDIHSVRAIGTKANINQ